MLLSWRPTPSSLAQRLAGLEGLEPSYAEVGATADPQLPAGYAVLEHATAVGHGRRGFEAAGRALLRWDLHREARMLVATSTPEVEVGTTVVNAAPFGPVSVLAVCRVVAVVEEAGRLGFAYGTLPGHPVRGEERLVVELDDDGVVQLRLRSFSRASGLAALAPLPTRLGQEWVNRRYAAAARRLAG